MYRKGTDKIKKISGEISKKEEAIKKENTQKSQKETEGNNYVKEARADLLKLSKILLQKKVENEDMKIERETLVEELQLISQSYDQCKQRCQSKKQSIEDEIKKINEEISNCKVKCVRCHQCTDTIDIRKFCTDCPRCIEERDCLYQGDNCSPDHAVDCVCMSVKQKFLENVFETMYTVLDRQIKTGPGKSVAETVLHCLKKSRNGKLDLQTRQILQDFILTTVKKNLNLTIVGGAVKTRCELDADTYKQLMLCLKEVKAVKAPKVDKETAAKKPPCPRWGGVSECNCPKGPKDCICTKRAPPPPTAPGPCLPQDEEDKGEEKTCPYKESTSCGPDCAMHAVPSAVGTDVAAWRPDPCQGPTCTFKNMRAAQCVLGPEALEAMFDSRSHGTAVPFVPNITGMPKNEIICDCEPSSMKPCSCKDVKSYPREQIIEEVMGKYFEVKPIDRVSYTVISNTKQMKVGTMTQCDIEICGIVRSNLYGHEWVSPTTKQQCSQNGLKVYVDDSKSLHDTIKNKHLKPTEKNVIDDKLKADLIKEQFKPILFTKSLEGENSFFYNINNKNDSKSSKASNLEIDESIIEMIESITRQDPNSFVSLNKSKSGHLSLGINSVRDDDGQTILLRRSTSGNMIIEIEKSKLNSLIANKYKNKLQHDKTTKTKNIDMHDPKVYKPHCSKNEDFVHNSDKIELSASKSNAQRNSGDLLKKMHKKGLRNIKIEIQHQGKKTMDIQAKLVQMPNENIAIHIKDENILHDNRKEFPVLVQKTQAGTININSDADVTTCNGVVTRTYSCGFMVHIRQSVSQELKLVRQNITKRQELFKVRIKGIDNEIKEPPAVIKRTSSGNFDVVLEKEYEKYFKQEIQNHIVEENGSFFDLTETTSSIVLDFEMDNKGRRDSQKALLMKFNTGHLKIIVSDAKYKDPFGSLLSTEGLRMLLRKLSLNFNLQDKNLSKTCTIKSKSNSDSNLYETAKFILHNNQNLFQNSSTTVKKTPSGQYALILDKDLKKSFINNLLSYLDKSNNGALPIKRSNSGVITISLDYLSQNTGIKECESLKITTSGNIYMMLDETKIRRISNDVSIGTSGLSIKSDISQCLELPEKKTLSRSYNSISDDIVSILRDDSKGVCESNKTVSIEDSCIEISSPARPRASKTLRIKDKYSRIHDKQNIKSKNKLPHITIRGYGSRTEPDKDNKFQESYYCEVQSVSPFNKYRREADSNKLIEIPGLCSRNKAQENNVVTNLNTYRKIKQMKPKKNLEYDWNSFEYLPHQLPPFLKNITYS